MILWLFFLDLKHVELVLIGSIIPFVILSFLIDESPRWLLTRGREKEAKNIIMKILNVNNLPESRLDLIKPKTEIVKNKNITHILAKKGMRRNLLLLCIYWFATSLGTYGLIFYTPAFDWNVYLVFVFPVFLNIPMSLLVPFLENKYILTTLR